MSLKRMAFRSIIVGAIVSGGVGFAQERYVDKIEIERPEWLFGNDACPADVMPDAIEKVFDMGDACIEKLDVCIPSCRDGNADDCYSAAQLTEDLEYEHTPQALFLMACRLGVPSGCTNRAAGHLNQGTDRDHCAVRTFEMTCDADDPWGCTMYGYFLYQGTDIEQDFDKARQVLGKSCKYGESHRACQVGKSILQNINAEDPQ